MIWSARIAPALAMATLASPLGMNPVGMTIPSPGEAEPGVAITEPGVSIEHFEVKRPTRYFVSPLGSDEHDGLSTETAFRTVVRGLETLSAGDTLTIMPGEYFGNARRENLGGAWRETVIQAAIPGSVLLRGDLPVPEFRPVDGYRFVCAADFPGETEAQAVNELDTLTILERLPGPPALESTPGTFYHDRASGKLYISPSDRRPAAAHHYSVSVVGTHGIALFEPRRVVIEGITVTGFNAIREQHYGERGFRTVWGILLVNPKDCVVRDCAAYLNGRGIAVNERATGGGNLVERCVAWANHSRFGDGGALTLFNPRNDEIRDSTAFLNPHTGVTMYGDNTEVASRLTDNLSWGNRVAFQMKTGRGPLHTAERCVGPGPWAPEARTQYAINCLVGDIRNIPAHYRGNIEPRHLAGIDFSAEFADPANHDYRLQATSRFRGAAPGGGDLGPFPWRPDIFYVRADGSDAADGLSAGKARRTPARLLPVLRPGDTLYLGGGVYRLPAAFTLSGTAQKPVTLRGRGGETVVLEGDLRVEDSRHLVFERIAFAGGVSVNGGENIAFNNCGFEGQETALAAEAVTGLRVTHCLFAGFATAAVAGRDSTGLFLAGNVYANRSGPALRLVGPGQVLYSDYNVYRDGENGWSLAGALFPLARLENGLDRHSRAATPEIVRENGVARLAAPLRDSVSGPLPPPVGPPLGISSRTPERILGITGPMVHSAGATTVNIEWSATSPARLEVGWGETPDCPNRETVQAFKGFGSFSVTGLAPGTRYHFRLCSVNPGGIDDDSAAPTGVEFSDGVIAFTTAAEEPPAATWHVSPAGSDANSGRNAGEPFRTIARAAAVVQAGDTVLIGEGVYHEQILVRATGTPDRPVTFRAAPGHRVFLDGDDKTLENMILLQDKSCVRIDGFYLKSVNLVAHRFEGAIRIFRGRDVRITRCFFDGFGPGYSPSFIFAINTADLLVENCVIAGGFGGPRLYACPGVTFRHNVFFRNMISHLLVKNFADQKAYLHNNIFTDSLPNKPQSGLLVLGRVEALAADNNAFFNRAPDDKRKPVFIYGTEAWDRVVLGLGLDETPERSASAVTENLVLGAADLRDRFGQGFFWFGDPRFQGALGQDFRDREGRAPGYTVDAMLGRGLARDFNDLFATEPELVRRGIGLDPEAFADFHFNRK